MQTTSYARTRAVASLSALFLAGCIGGGDQYVGGMVGDPTGLSYKQELNDTDAVTAGLGLGFADGDAFHGHVDYIRRLSVGGDADFYAGLGVRVRVRSDDTPGNDDRDDFDFGPRVPFGVQVDLPGHNMHLFAEFAIGADLVHPKATVDLALGLRFGL